MNPVAKSKPLMILGGVATALIAAFFAIFWFDLLTPPRDLATIGNGASARPRPPTATPTTLPPTPHVAINDDFVTRTNWPSGGPKSAFGYTDQGYSLDAPPNGFNKVLLANFHNTNANDMTLVTTAASASGSPFDGYGVLFWHSTDKSKGERFLCVTIGADGSYRVQAHIPLNTDTTTKTVQPTPNSPGGEWIDLVPATRTIAANTGTGPNLLRVDVHPHRLLILINNVLVLDRQDPDIDQYRQRSDFDGQVGLISISSGQADSKVLFSNFSLFANPI